MQVDARRLRLDRTGEIEVRRARQVGVNATFSANIVTGTTTVFSTCNCGGVAYVGVYGLATNHSYYQPAFVFIADESPLHRKLGVYENRG